MEISIWTIFIFSWCLLLVNHSCNTKTLNSIILLPSPSASGISYEALHYPSIPADQYQLIPLIINTGKIPLINHPVQAPIQYFTPKQEEDQLVAKLSKDLGPQYSTLSRLSTTARSQQSDDFRIKNHPAKKKYYPPTTVYSEKHVEGQPSTRYSYGYEIIEGDIDSSDRKLLRSDEPEIRSSDDPDRIQRVIEYIANHEPDSPNFNTVVYHRQQVDKSNDNLNPSQLLEPIIIKPDLKTINTQLKKHYKNSANLKIPIAYQNNNENLTTVKP